MHLMTDLEAHDTLAVVHYDGQFRNTTVLLDTHTLRRGVSVTCSPERAGGVRNITIVAHGGPLPFAVHVGTTLLGSVSLHHSNCSGAESSPDPAWPISAWLRKRAAGRRKPAPRSPAPRSGVRGRRGGAQPRRRRGDGRA